MWFINKDLSDASLSILDSESKENLNTNVLSSISISGIGFGHFGAVNNSKVTPTPDR